MEKTDRQTDKSSRWAFTAYEEQWHLFNTMPPGIAEWGWNAEVCPKTNRKHYQGYLRLTAQQRFAWLKKILPGVHIEISRNWEALKLYCQKDETRIEGTRPKHEVSSFMTIYQYVDSVAERIAKVLKATGQKIEETPKAQRIQYVDDLVRQDICEGKRYAGHIATNPQWVTLWNKYSYEYIFSFTNINATRTSETQGTQDSPREGQGEEVPGQEPDGSHFRDS